MEKPPLRLQPLVDFVIERYKAFKYANRNLNAKLELLKEYYEGYNYQDDLLGEGKNRLREVEIRTLNRLKSLEDIAEGDWKFVMNDNVFRQVVNHYIVDYVVTSPSFVFNTINNDFAKKEIAKAFNKLIQYVLEYNKFDLIKYKSAMLSMLSGSSYWHIYPENGEIKIKFKPMDMVCDDGESLELDDSDFIIICHDFLPFQIEQTFSDYYQKTYKNKEPYEVLSYVDFGDYKFSLQYIFDKFNGLSTKYQTEKKLTKTRFLEVITSSGLQIWIVQTGDDSYEFLGVYESPYKISEYPIVRLKFEDSPLSSQGSTFLPDLIEKQNAINFITNTAVNNAVESSVPKRFIDMQTTMTDQDGENQIIPIKAQTFYYNQSPIAVENKIPVIFYDKPPVISPELYSVKNEIISSIYERYNITPASRGLLPASRTSAKSLDILLQQRNNHSQPYMVLYKHALEDLAKKILLLSKEVFSREKLDLILGEDSMLSVDKFIEYIPEKPLVKIQAGSEVDTSGGQREMLILQLLQYGGIEAFSDDKLMQVMNLNKDGLFNNPADADRAMAQIQISSIINGDELDKFKPERGQNHLIFEQEVNKLKKTRLWTKLNEDIKDKIRKWADQHIMAYHIEMAEVEGKQALAREQVKRVVQQQLGATAPSQIPQQPQSEIPQPAQQNITDANKRKILTQDLANSIAEEQTVNNI